METVVKYQQEETTFINEIVDKMEDFTINKSCFTFFNKFSEFLDLDDLTTLLPSAHSMDASTQCGVITIYYNTKHSNHFLT